MIKVRAPLAILAGTCVVLGLTACNDSNKNADKSPLNERPDFVSGDIQATEYDGTTNDLLTAGLGASRLATGPAPSFADAINPTAEELRALAIYNNYRALVDTVPGGGYGSLFGPQVDTTAPEGKIPGDEYLAFMTVPGSVPVSVMVQVPDTFNPRDACMVTAPSSGSRGIYGAIGTAGEWGLKKGCAVVYTDKGTGTGSHNLEANTAQTLTGQLTDNESVASQFRADLDVTGREQFNTEYPNRFAFKHAHSKANPEADWGLHVLQSIEFGFYILNEQFGEETDDGRRVTVTPDNTLVIASSVSNGGGASVRAAEQDTDGLIDGVAVSEPNVNPVVDKGFTIRQGSGPVIEDHSRSLFDYTTALAVYQGCANRAPAIRAEAPLNEFFNVPQTNENICTSLKSKGLVTGADVDAQATDALRILNEDFGIQSEQNLVAPSHFGLAVAQSISMTYANAYGQFGVEDRICGLSLAATNGSTNGVAALTETQEAALFSVSNGIPPTGGVNLVFDKADGMPTNLRDSISPTTGLTDYGLDALLCLRSLADGPGPVIANPLTDENANNADNATRIAEGIEAIRATGDLQGKPAIFVTGRSDAILPINHTSRPYYGLNQRVEGADSGLRYYEVLNAQHLDILNGFAGFNELYIPLHRYYFQALDLMYDHLKNGNELPPSQVVRTVPRGAGAPALDLANVPPVAANPASGNLIVFESDQLRIPD